MKDSTSIIDSRWSFRDYLGALRVRLAIGRHNYRVEPGLYRLGQPQATSDVFVTANYKLSFDFLRKNLAGMNAWILVLDTNGVNVWCAAGKGTFGTRELEKQIAACQLSQVVSHRRLILPQLGAPGVAAHLIKQETGFTVKFGPTRANDIKAYIANRYRKTDAMRTVNFSVLDRLLLAPVEIVESFLKFVLVVLLFLLIAGLSKNGFSLAETWEQGAQIALLLFVAYLAGTVLTPFLLPWIPLRAFAAKGLVSGMIAFGGLYGLGIIPAGWPAFMGLLSLMLAVSSFLAMNFTGASNYTSLSGVLKEMRLFVPVQISLLIAGLVLFIIYQFTG